MSNDWEKMLNNSKHSDLLVRLFGNGDDEQTFEIFEQYLSSSHEQLAHKNSVRTYKNNLSEFSYMRRKRNSFDKALDKLLDVVSNEHKIPLSDIALKHILIHAINAHYPSVNCGQQMRYISDCKKKLMLSNEQIMMLLESPDYIKKRYDRLIRLRKSICSNLKTHSTDDNFTAHPVIENEIKGLTRNAVIRNELFRILKLCRCPSDLAQSSVRNADSSILPKAWHFIDEIERGFRHLMKDQFSERLINIILQQAHDAFHVASGFNKCTKKLAEIFATDDPKNDTNEQHFTGFSERLMNSPSSIAPLGELISEISDDPTVTNDVWLRIFEHLEFAKEVYLIYDSRIRIGTATENDRFKEPIFILNHAMHEVEAKPPQHPYTFIRNSTSTNSDVRLSFMFSPIGTYLELTQKIDLLLETLPPDQRDKIRVQMTDMLITHKSSIDEIQTIVCREDFKTYEDLKTLFFAIKKVKILLKNQSLYMHEVSESLRKDDESTPSTLATDAKTVVLGQGIILSNILDQLALELSKDSGLINEDIEVIKKLAIHEIESEARTRNLQKHYTPSQNNDQGHKQSGQKKESRHSLASSAAKAKRTHSNDNQATLRHNKKGSTNL